MRGDKRVPWHAFSIPSHIFRRFRQACDSKLGSAVHFANPLASSACAHCLSRVVAFKTALGDGTEEKEVDNRNELSHFFLSFVLQRTFRSGWFSYFFFDHQPTNVRKGKLFHWSATPKQCADTDPGVRGKNWVLCEQRK